STYASLEDKKHRHRSHRRHGDGETEGRGDGEKERRREKAALQSLRLPVPLSLRLPVPLSLRLRISAPPRLCGYAYLIRIFTRLAAKPLTLTRTSTARSPPPARLAGNSTFIWSRAVKNPCAPAKSVLAGFPSMVTVTASATPSSSFGFAA